MHRMPVLMALLAGIMFTSMPAGKSLTYATAYTVQAHKAAEDAPFGDLPLGEVQHTPKSASGEELPVYEPGFSALAQVAPLQFFFYQPAILPVITPLVEIVEQVSVSSPDLVNRFHRILFRRIISPNAP